MQNDELISLLKAISDKQDQAKEASSGLDKKLDLHIQKTDYRFEMLEKLDAEQNAILAEHSQRSTELQRDNDLREKRLRMEILGEGSPHPEKSLKGRVDKLEEPGKWATRTFKLLLAIGAASSALFAIMKFFKKL